MAREIRVRSRAPRTRREITDHLKAQRKEIVALCKKSRALQTRTKHFCADMIWLSREMEKSRRKLAGGYPMAIRITYGAKKDYFSPALAAAIAEALKDAIEIFEFQFSGTRGSGRETLEKCRLALKEIQAVRAARSAGKT